MKYYVYIYLDQTKFGDFNYLINNIWLSFKYEPFYVGLGKRKDRLFEHLKESESTAYNKHKFRRINKIKRIANKNPIIIKLYENLSPENAKQLEIKMITTIGRRNLLTGPLTNLTDGGDGLLGYKPTNKTKEKWKKSIDKYYSIPENRKQAGYYNTIEWFTRYYGKKLGSKKYRKGIERMRKSIHKTYKDQSIRDKCANFNDKNGMYGKPCPTAREVIIYKKIYNSIYKASKETNIPYTTLSQRLNSKNFPDFKFS